MGCVSDCKEEDLIVSKLPLPVEEEEFKKPPIIVSMKRAHTERKTRQITDFWEQFEFKKNIGIGLKAKRICIVKHRISTLPYVAKVMDDQQVFNNELKMVSRFHSLYILRFKDAYRDLKSSYILYEYCIGDYLLNTISTMHRYNEYLASKTVYMMLHAVKYLHDMNIIHRDIRPNSFFYSTKRDTGLKLMEFESAMDITTKSTYNFRTGRTYFMSPEMVQNKPRSGYICKKGDVWSLGVCVFLMLNGVLPFSGLEESDVFDKIQNGKLKFKPGISDDGKDLIRKLLHRDPNERLSVDEALEHPWVMNNGKTDVDVLQSTVEGLRLFHVKNSIGSLFEQIVNKNMDEHDEAHFKELYSRFDINGDGSISRDECVQALLMDGLYRGRVESIVDELMSMSGNQQNSISYENFKEKMILQQLTSDDYIQDAVFSALDSNGDGYISINELIMSLPKANAETVLDIIEKFKEADKNNDDLLSFAEFKDLFSGDDHKEAFSFQRVSFALAKQNES